jgi:hypothetical protein
MPTFHDHADMIYLIMYECPWCLLTPFSRPLI